MTIAVGMVAKDSIVLAADTQETGYMKRRQPKIMSANIEPADGAIAISGAGSAEYIDSVTGELMDDYFRLKTDISLKVIKDTLRGRVKTFYKEHVIPFAQYPDNARPDFWLIIATQKQSRSQLYTTAGSTLSGCVYGAVGAGAELAKTLLLRLYPHFPTADSAEVLATYVVFHVKEMIDGCGKDTTIVRLENNHAAHGSSDRTAAMEELFRSHLNVERDAVHYILGSPEAGFIESIPARYKALREEISSLFQRFPNKPLDTVGETSSPIW